MRRPSSLPVILRTWAAAQVILRAWGSPRACCVLVSTCFFGRMDSGAWPLGTAAMVGCGFPRVITNFWGVRNGPAILSTESFSADTPPGLSRGYRGSCQCHIAGCGKLGAWISARALELKGTPGAGGWAGCPPAVVGRGLRLRGEETAGGPESREFCGAGDGMDPAVCMESWTC